MMGTEVSISVMCSDTILAEKAIDLAFNEMLRLENLMSRYTNDSCISKLNKEGHLEGAPPEVTYVIDKSKYFSNLSEGAFDITIKPLIDLLSYCFSVDNRPPTDEEIQSKLELVDFREVSVHGGDVELKESGMGVTLDGIAKGYIVDKAIEILADSGINHALINAGGDIRTLGGKLDDKAWRIAIKNPMDERNYAEILDITDRSVATSGNYELYFTLDKKWHHIVDPRTGYCPFEVTSATIVTEKAVDADALATTTIVLGPEKGMALIKGLGNAEALFINQNGNMIKSKGLSDLISL
jgi:thiamine biosynthesis lipoprotein